MRLRGSMMLAGAVMVGVAAAVACNDFGPEPAIPIKVEQDGLWKTAIDVSDSDTLAIRVMDAQGQRIDGAEIGWETSDSSVFAVSRLLPSAGGDRRDTLQAQLRAEVRALSEGEALILATVTHPAFHPEVHSDSISAVLLRITEVPTNRPDTIFVTDVETIGIQLETVDSSLVGTFDVAWESSDASVLSVVADSSPLQAVMTAVAHGTASVSVVVGRPGAPDVRLDTTVVVQEKWISISAGTDHTCGITVRRDAYCWGWTHLGNGITTGAPQVNRVAGGLKFFALAAGRGNTCGISAAHSLGGQVYCWGQNKFGALGTGDIIDRLTPALVLEPRLFTSIGSGRDFFCAVGLEPIDAQHWNGLCWGVNDRFQLGNSQPTDLCPTNEAGMLVQKPCSTLPVVVGGQLGKMSDSIGAVAPGDQFVCALPGNPGDTRQPVCWGDHPAIGTGPGFSTVPSLVPGAPLLKSIVSGSFHSCGLDPGGAAHCWGQNFAGQLGDGSFTSGTKPSVPVTGGHTFTALSAGRNTTCGIRAADSTTWCWGQNNRGQLGNGSFVDESSPVIVDLPGSRFVAISVGGGCSVNLSTNSGSVVVDRKLDCPWPFGSPPGPEQSHVCGITVNGAAWCWGSNYSSQLGTFPHQLRNEPIPQRVSEPVN